MSHLLGLDAPGWVPRYKHNVIVYLWVYGILGGVTGITNNALLSYLDIVAPKVVTGLDSISAVSTVLMAMMILTVHNLGYRKILLVAAPITVFSLVATTVTTNSLAIVIAYLISQTTIGLYDYMYPLMFSVYVPEKVRTKLFTVVMSVNLICQTVVTFFGGKLVVWFFSKLQGLTYNRASEWTAHQDLMHHAMLMNYSMAYKWIIFVAVAMNVVAFFITFGLKEQPADYRTVTSKEATENDEKHKLSNYKKLATKPVIMFIVYIALVQMGAQLVTPYFPIYLNNYLHIPRGITSTINTIQTAAMFIGYFTAPFLEKKLGTVVAVASSTIACVPLMIIMGSGRALGSGMALIVIITVTLFLRSGIANATMPVQNNLQMLLVDKDLRPAFTALANLILGAVGFIDGLFTEFYLLRTMSGYATAYYIASALYLIGSICLLVALTRKYNRIGKATSKSADSNIEFTSDEKEE